MTLVPAGVSSGYRASSREKTRDPQRPRRQNAPWNNFYTSASPQAHHNEQRGIDSWSNDRDRHSNSIITTFTIKSALNILYLHFRPGLGLSVRTFVLMCCITEQRTIRIENNHANTQINDKSINFKCGEINCTHTVFDCWNMNGYHKEILHRRARFPIVYNTLKYRTNTKIRRYLYGIHSLTDALTET